MKVLVLSSGGIDSSTCLGLAVKEYGKENVVALSIFYGQKHDKELKASDAVANYYGVEHIKLNLSSIFDYSDCSLLSHSNQEIAHESLFISSAASIALSKGCSKILYGAHSDDAAGNAYPDCSQVFNDAMNKAIYEGSGRQLVVEAPFVNMNKAGVVKTGLEIGVPYELTWSCYEGNDKPCGKCGTCIDTQAAFEANGTVDPLLK